MLSINSFFSWAHKRGWEIDGRDNIEQIPLSENITKRYPRIPKEYLDFLKTIKICITPDEKSWFICLDEYNGASELAFSWDEIEKMSFIEGDIEYNIKVSEFWNNHLPIAMSVRDGYSYYAIKVNDDFGVVVSGYEPEFEETEFIASSFLEFLEMIMNNRILF